MKSIHRRTAPGIFLKLVLGSRLILLDMLRILHRLVLGSLCLQQTDRFHILGSPELQIKNHRSKAAR